MCVCECVARFREEAEGAKRAGGSQVESPVDLERGRGGAELWRVRPQNHVYSRVL